MESYPRQCRVPDGITFMEILSEEGVKRVFPAQGDKQNLCGNNICEDISCSAIGCPIPETPDNCPADCAE